MLQPLFEYPCCFQNLTGSVVYRPCPACGSDPVFSSWLLTPEFTARRFRYTHGLKESGPHLELAERVLGPFREECSRCEGIGFLQNKDRTRQCSDCEGTGGHWIGDEELLAAAYSLVLDHFPDAAAPGSLSSHGFLTERRSDR